MSPFKLILSIHLLFINSLIAEGSSLESCKMNQLNSSHVLYTYQSIDACTTICRWFQKDYSNNNLVVTSAYNMTILNNATCASNGTSKNGSYLHLPGEYNCELSIDDLVSATNCFKTSNGEEIVIHAYTETNDFRNVLEELRHQKKSWDLKRVKMGANETIILAIEKIKRFYTDNSGHRQPFMLAPTKRKAIPSSSSTPQISTKLLAVLVLNFDDLTFGQINNYTVMDQFSKLSLNITCQTV